MCSQHQNKHTEFYCVDHCKLLCSLCLLKTESHKNCAKVIEIDSAGKSFLTTKFTDNVSDTCFKTAQSAGSVITEVKNAKECSSNLLKSLNCEIENTRSKMLEAFDRQSNNIIQSVSTDLLGNSSKCEKALQNLETLSKRMTESESLFKNIIDNGSRSDVFRCVLSVIGQYEDFQREIEETKRHCSRQNAIFERLNLIHIIDQNPFLLCNVQNIALDIEDTHTDQFKQRFRTEIAMIPTEVVARDEEKPRFGYRTVESKPSSEWRPTRLYTSSDSEEDEYSYLYSSSEPTPDVDINISYCRNFAIDLSDGESPWFGGIVCLSDERLILSDYKNSQIVMVRKKTTLAEEGIGFMPGNLTLFNQSLIVCLINTNKLLLMKIGDNSLKVDRYLQTRYHPKYVQAVDSERILVSSKKGNDDWYLELKTLQGKTWGSAEIDVELDGIYNGYKLAVQHVPDLPDEFRIVQYCEEQDDLHCFQETGGPALFHYEVENVSSIITDHLGYIFVIRYPGEVQVLSPDGNFVTSVHRKAMKRIKFSAFNKSMDKLFVTENKNSKIHVLDVKRE